MTASYGISKCTVYTRHYLRPRPSQVSTRLSLDLLIHKQPSHTLSGTNAHTRDEDLLLRPSGLAQYRTDLSCTSRAQWVTQRNGASARVDLLMFEAEVIQAVDGHGSESLVDLVNVDVGLGQVEFAEKLGDGGCRADTHDARRHTGNGGAAELGQDRLVQFNGLGAAHEEDSSSWRFMVSSLMLFRKDDTAGTYHHR